MLNSLLAAAKVGSPGAVALTFGFLNALATERQGQNYPCGEQGCGFAIGGQQDTNANDERGGQFLANYGI